MPCVFSASDGGVPLRDPVGQLLLCGQQTGHAQQGGLCLQWRTLIPACYSMQTNTYAHAHMCMRTHNSTLQIYPTTTPPHTQMHAHSCTHSWGSAMQTYLNIFKKKCYLFVWGFFFFNLYILILLEVNQVGSLKKKTQAKTKDFISF